jgi:ribokinase
MTIAVFGSVNIDIVARVSRLPSPGETCHALGHSVSLGGKGANQAVAAQRLYQGDVRLSAAIGSDTFGTQALEMLETHGLETGGIIRLQDQDTGLALIHVDANSQNSITVIAGANMCWPDAGPGQHVFAGAKVALFQLETPIEAVRSAMVDARAAGCTVVLDPAPVPDREISGLISLADIVTPNERETEAITGLYPSDTASALEAAERITAEGCRIAIVKLGDRGLVFATSDGHSGTVPAYRVNAIDTVAAGDCFNGALAAALASGRDIDNALDFAAAAAALSTTRRGAADSIPSLPDVLEFMKSA